jgi:hypothetical protein
MSSRQLKINTKKITDFQPVSYIYKYWTSDTYYNTNADGKFPAVIESYSWLSIDFTYSFLISLLLGRITFSQDPWNPSFL